MSEALKEEKKSELDVRDREQLDYAYNLASTFVKKNYLSELSNHEVVEVPEEIKDLKVRDTFRFFQVDKIVYDKQENNLDKLANVYNALDDANSSLIMVLDSDRKGIDLYLGVRVDNEDRNPTMDKHILKKSFTGNFPGSQLQNLNNSEIEEMIDNVTKSRFREKEKIISSVSGIPSLMDEDKEKFVQGIEKLIDAMQGEKFSAIFIADTVSQSEIEEIEAGYENLYSQLVPFANSELNFGMNESQAVTEGITEGFTKTVNHSVTQTQSYTEGTSTTESYTTNSSTTKNKSAVLGAAGAAVGSVVPGVGTVAGGAAGALAGSLLGSKTKGESHTNSQTQNYSETHGSSETEGESESRSLQHNKSGTETIGSSKGIQLKFENKRVSNLLEKIDKQLDRLRESRDFGMWNTSCYFLADDKQTANVAASTYKALMRGENSAVENSYINVWDNDEQTNLERVKDYLKKLHHPLINMNVDNELDIPKVTPSSLISGRELTIQMGLPTKSVNGVTVMETAEFGRNIITYDGNEKSNESIELGKIFHMGQTERTKVELDLNSLTSHTFVTGSTGSGKSNTIYKILDEVRKKRRNFLVVEPAKGEYKEVFGGYDDVNVYGTNPKYTELLKINPFKFSEEIHVLEHIDRLIEIFNACWPMYAAMPAVLKEGIEQAYQRVGWDLENSIYLGKTKTYPTFDDLLKVLPDIIENSGYSAEVKSNYTGALVTRIRSLTNGLVGRMFVNDEIDNEKLFKENCIIDLSRIGSMETKSLLMGVVFMRLHEDRYANFSEADSDLKHITVLEEAHHLLRKSSFDQNQENSNLQGKSVEMISNAIAEMRTYGEGFIIADQSPDMLDSSVIKNTNTKIILKLPDESDRELVGKAANLNDDQVTEISKLKTGVAAIYQNNWLQPILCNIDEHKRKRALNYESDLQEKFDNDKSYRGKLMKLLLQDNEGENLDLDKIDIEGLKEWVMGLDLKPVIKNKIINNLNQLQLEGKMDLWEQDRFEKLSEVTAEVIDSDKLVKFAADSNDLKEWNQRFKVGLRNYVDLKNKNELETKLVKCLLQNKAQQDESLENFYFNWVERIERG